MKKTLKKSLSLFLAVVIVLTTACITPLIVHAVDTAETIDNNGISFWADPENRITQEDITAYQGGNKTTMTGAVGIFRYSGSYYLFLPSNADCTKLKVWFTAASAEVNGVAVTSGQPTDVFKDINESGVSKSYTVKLGSSSYNVTAMKSGDVATVYIDTTSGSIKSINSSKSNSESGTIMVVQPDGKIDYDGVLEKMSGRGNGTWDHTTKKPYNIKLGVSTKLLGMPKAKKWCLLANYDDATLIKNQLSYDFADYIGIKYQPHCKPVDLYVNQQYLGSYQLAEKVEIKSNRINITDAYENLEIANGTTDPATGITTPKDLTGSAVTYYTAPTTSYGTGTESSSLSTLKKNTFAQTTGNKKYSKNLKNPTDYSGGYLYELEISQRWINENAGFCAYNRQCWVLKNCDYATKEMVNYSYDLLYAMGSAVYNNGVVPSDKTPQPNGTSSAVGGTTGYTNDAPAEKYRGRKWSDILDADSAVRYYWTQEYFKNMDSSTSSTYFYKDVDDVDTKVYAGPMWDMDQSIGFDRGSGSRYGYSWTSSTGWYTRNARIYRYITSQQGIDKDTDAIPYNFYAALARNCTDFWQMAQAYWFSTIEPATKILLGEATDPKGILHSTEYYATTIAKSGAMNAVRHGLSDYNAASVTSGMNTWFTERDNWINKQFSKVDIANCTVSPIANQTCTGRPIEPAVTITYNGTTLREGEDYTIEYSNNIAAGKNATVTITGKGLYTGTKDVTFMITSGSLITGKASIPENAYAGDTITATVTDSNGTEIERFIEYQWYADATPISGATSKSYTVDAANVGKKITVEISGDGSNFANFGITSNICNILEGTRPTGYTKSIASWDYDYTVNPDALVTADASGQTYYYMATSGENADSAELRASVNAVDNAVIKWSGNTDLYANDSTSLGNDQSPVMGTSKTTNLAWGEYPYFETSVSTLGYENIQFSAKLGGTNKGPSDWKLQYSLDGENYTDIDGATYSFKDNEKPAKEKNKSMEQAFNEVNLPAECENQSRIYIRAIVSADVSIDGKYAVIGSLSGDASINNIRITGASTAVVSKLDAPVFSTDVEREDNTTLFSTEKVMIKDTNGGADVYYSVNGGEEKLYEGAFNPFDIQTAKKGDTAVIEAYAKFEDVTSSVSEFEVTFAGVNISEFSFSNYSKNVSNGYVFSTNGVYGKSGKMSAYTDGSSQYVPLWNDDKKAFCVAPDDGMLWSAQSGFYFEIPTAGYENIDFTCKAYTTAQGPNSASLQYSVDGTEWKNVQTNVQLNADNQLDQVFMTTRLPAECNNLAKVYIRVVTTENRTHGDALTVQADLHSNASKGNFYINDVVISGEDNSDYKMPYTNKTTNYFGNGAIEYVSPSGVDMKYTVVNADGEVVQSGSYPATGILLSSVKGFSVNSAGPYTVSIWAGDDDDRSLVNTRKYYYKGDTVVKFNYNDSTRALSNYLSVDLTTATNTSGANSGTLSMYPDSSHAAVLDYTNVYGVKVAWASDNVFKSTAQLDNPAGAGYWLVETSTKGFTDLTLNLEQLSSNKGPRDWGLAYSTDGSEYKYVEKSNVRAISNDASGSTVETYNNMPLPAECNDQEKLYIKVFINGGEAVNGDELKDALKGNTGINGIELSGVAIPPEATAIINTVALEEKNATTGTYPVDATVIINGNEYTTTDGSVEVPLSEGTYYTVKVSANGKTFVNEFTFTAAAQQEFTVPVVFLDMNGDGCVNAKDYVLISRIRDTDKKDYYKSIYPKFVNVKSNSFSYAK